VIEEYGIYRNGGLTRKYSVGELVKNPSGLARSGAGLEWHKRVAFDDAASTLEVTLTTGQKKLFGIKSGGIIPPGGGKSRKLEP